MKTVTSVDIWEFWTWFRSHATSLASTSDQAIADELQRILVGVDGAISVEVATIPMGSRNIKEVIISGSGDRSAARQVKRLVAEAPFCDGWRFVALKPERGFNFQIEVNAENIDASTLFFDPMTSSEHPDLFGILVYCPDELSRSENVAELMNLIVETGVGEEAASEIATIRVEADSRRPSGALPIQELPAYIKWRLGKAGRVRH